MGWMDKLLGRDQPPMRPTLPTVKAPPGVNPNPRSAAEWRSNAAARRKRSEALGLTEYRWLAARPDGCRTAERNGGKVFCYDSPPAEGHPGECECDFDFCRYCTANAIVPGCEP